jgi:hypothetical protein
VTRSSGDEHPGLISADADAGGELTPKAIDLHIAGVVNQDASGRIGNHHVVAIVEFQVYTVTIDLHTGVKATDPPLRTCGHAAVGGATGEAHGSAGSAAVDKTCAYAAEVDIRTIDDDAVAPSCPSYPHRVGPRLRECTARRDFCHLR